MYRWSNRKPDGVEFNSGQLQLDPWTARINAAYRGLQNKRIRCP